MPRPPKCRVCLKERKLNRRGLCGLCARLSEIARRNLEAAATKTTIPPPSEIVRCEDCGEPMEPICFRPNRWTHYCAANECHNCLTCGEFVQKNKPCTCWFCGDCSGARAIAAGQPCPCCGARQKEVSKAR